MLQHTLDHAELLGALALLGFNLSFIFQAPGLVLVLGALGFSMMGALVDNLNMHYVFWAPLCMALGALAGGFLPVVIDAPKFVSAQGALRYPTRTWRAIALASVMLGVTLWWALYDHSQRWFWAVPTAVSALVILVSYALFSYDSLWNMPRQASLYVHGWWALFLVPLQVALGLLDVYVSDTYARLYVPMLFGGALLALTALNVLLPGVAKVNSIPETLAHALHAVLQAESHEDLGALAAADPDHPQV